VGNLERGADAVTATGVAPPNTQTKDCAVCGRPFKFKRQDALTCGSACRKKLSRLGGKPPRLHGDDQLAFFSPRSLFFADLALAKGVPLYALTLADIERAALVASSPRFPIEVRLKSAKELLNACAPWAWTRQDRAKLSDGQLEFMALAALEAAKNETTSFGTVGRRGRPWKVSPYVPAEEPWAFLLHDFLPREIGRILRPIEDERRRYENDPVERALRLEGPAGDEFDNELTLAETVGVASPDGDDEEPCLVHRRSSAGFATEKQALRRATRRPPGYDQDVLNLRLGSGELTNPDLDRWELAQLRSELSRGGVG
jgi:hypothetical protein